MLYHRELVERMQEKYPPGTRVEVVSLCNEEEHLKPGMKGTVIAVDDQPALLVNWDNGSSLEDFLQPGVRELTKPLFSIPTHQFLFNPGQLEPKAFCDTLQLEQAEFELIRYPERGTCLYRCGNERYLLQVHFPEFKEAMFGKSGGR